LCRFPERKNATDVPWISFSSIPDLLRLQAPDLRIQVSTETLILKKFMLA
jgi:hypothetical protein